MGPVREALEDFTQGLCFCAPSGSNPTSDKTPLQRRLAPIIVAYMPDVTHILDSLVRGDAHAAAQLLPLVYGELRRLAAQKLAAENPGHTLEATALVHEAYLRLVKGEAAEERWDHRGHFFAAAAEAMRRILVEDARRKKRLKRGGDLARRELAEDQLALPAPREDLEALDEALAALAQEDGPKAELVKLRYFAGLSEDEAASCLGISRATAARWWTYARAWLFDRLGGK